MPPKGELAWDVLRGLDSLLIDRHGNCVHTAVMLSVWPKNSPVTTAVPAPVTSNARGTLSLASWTNEPTVFGADDEKLTSL